MNDSDLILLDTARVAEILGVSRPTLERWRTQGVGPRFVRHGRWIRYRLRDLEDFLERGLRPDPSEDASAA
jgi:predicted site-specific integrase-resolvase